MATILAGAILISACSSSAQHSEADDLEFLQHNGGDPAALDARFGKDAQAACAIGADAYLESVSSQEHKWTDDAVGPAGIKFDKTGDVSAGAGLLTLISTRALIANGSGGFDPVTFYCLYDAMARKVIRYSQEAPAAEATTAPAPQTDAAGMAPPPPAEVVVPPQELPPLDPPATGAPAAPPAPVAQPPGDAGNIS